MYTLNKKIITQSRGLSQEGNLLMYFHRLHQARQVADLPGKVLLGEEAKRVKGKILFIESQEAQ